MELWKTGNAEARILALLIADPAKVSRADADKLVKEGPDSLSPPLPFRFPGAYARRGRNASRMDEVEG